MPKANVTLTVEGATELNQRLNVMLKNTRDLRPAWKAFYTPAYERAEKAYFGSQGEGSWAPLDAAYVRWKAKKGYSTGILEMTGTLKQSLVGNNRYTLRRYNPQWMWAGTGDPVGNILGSPKRKKRRMPLNVESNAMRTEIREATVQHLDSFEAMWMGRKR